MEYEKMISDFREHREMLVEQIEYLEAGNQIRRIGEEPEVSTAKFLTSLRKHMADLDHLIPECEAMRRGPVP